ncbi:hypothetical protein OTU49_000802, partial [Cherax quadricarinatus]
MEGNETESAMEDWAWEEMSASKHGNGSSETPGRGWGSSLAQKDETTRRKAACEALHATLPTPDPSFGPYCPRTFDGWSCWNDTPAGTRAYVQCPDFVIGFDPQ